MLTTELGKSPVSDVMVRCVNDEWFRLEQSDAVFFRITSDAVENGADPAQAFHVTAWGLKGHSLIKLGEPIIVGDVSEKAYLERVEQFVNATKQRLRNHNVPFWDVEEKPYISGERLCPN